MLRQLFTKDVSTIKRHIWNHQQGNGPMVVALIAGWSGIPQVHDVREEHSPVGLSQQQQERRFVEGLPLLPPSEKKLEVQLHTHGGQPWHLAQTLYLKIEEE
jgi:hypothetical protein